MGLFKKKKKKLVVEEKPQQVKLAINTDGVKPIFGYDERWEEKSFRSILSIMDVKAILYNIPGQPIALANGYAGYLQFLEVYGKDIATLSDDEQRATIQSYQKWLSSVDIDFTEQTTTLPTDVKQQQDYMNEELTKVRYELESGRLTDKERVYLTRRSDILLHNLMILEIIANQKYNTEFFVWIFGNTLEELNANVKKAMTVSSGFRLHHVTADKKEIILKQYYNSNEPV